MATKDVNNVELFDDWRTSSQRAENNDNLPAQAGILAGRKFRLHLQAVPANGPAVYRPSVPLCSLQVHDEVPVAKTTTFTIVYIDAWRKPLKKQQSQSQLGNYITYCANFYNHYLVLPVVS
jgi:hypothetical protein